MPDVERIINESWSRLLPLLRRTDAELAEELRRFNEARAVVRGNRPITSEDPLPIAEPGRVGPE